MPPRSFRQIAPGRLEVREGGGCMAAFGLPFLASGLFMMLACAGVVPLKGGESAPWFMMPALLFMGLVFTLVGGVLVFGRSWTTLSSGDRTVVMQMGLLAPMSTKTYRVDDYNGVSVEFVRGDSDSADQYPVSLRARAGQNLRLFSSNNYADARERATAIAALFHLEIEDSSTGRSVRLSAAQADMSFQHRQRIEHQRDEVVVRPAPMRSSVSETNGSVTIVIPESRVHPAMFLFFLIPIAVPVLMFDPFLRFFRQSHTPDVVSWIFLGFLILAFGVLPAYSGLSAFLKARRGRTTVTVSTSGVRIDERRVWKTRTLASLSSTDILDVDCSTTELIAPPAVGERTARVLKIVRALSKSGGVTIKTRQGLTTFGQGLDDREVRYLHYVVRQAIVR